GAADPAHAHHPAVLDQLPHPRLRLDRHPQGQRPAQQPAPGRGADRPTAAPAAHGIRRVSRHRVFVPALHGAAALRHAGAHGPEPARGGGGSRRAALEGLLDRDAAALPARRDRGLPAGVHPRRGRVRDPGPAGWIRCADDGQGAVDGVLHQPRLAPRLGHRRAPAAHAGGAHHAAATRRETRRCGGRTMNRRPFALFTVLAFGYAFLYIPIISLIVYSFNASRLVTVWGGFSTKWYGELLRNEQL